MPLAAASLLAVGCHKDEDAPKTKVSRIYRTSHIKMEMYSAATGTWATLRDSDHERAIYYEFYWSGDRLDSLRNGPSNELGSNITVFADVMDKISGRTDEKA